MKSKIAMAFLLGIFVMISIGARKYLTTQQILNDVLVRGGTAINGHHTTQQALNMAHNVNDNALNIWIDTLDFLVVTDSIKASSGIWWYCKYIDALNVAEGASGATWTAPTYNTIGGYQLNANTEYLYFNGNVCNNWIGASDIEIVIVWELNVASVSATDTVELDLLCWYKGETEDTTKYQALNVRTCVGNETRYTMHRITFEMDWDLANNVIEVGDIISFRLNLDTANSDKDDVIFNFTNYRYLTDVPQVKNY